MTAVTTVTIITARPGLAEEVERLLCRLTTTVTTGTGGARYCLQRALDDPDVFIMTEKWDSCETIQDHLSAPELRTLLQTGDLYALPPQVIYLLPAGAAPTYEPKVRVSAEV